MLEMRHGAQAGLNPARIAAMLSLLGAIVWSVHVSLTVALPPFDGPVDVVVHVIMGVLKIASILVFPFALRPLFERLQGDFRNVRTFVLFFGLGYVFLFSLYILFGRESMALYASGDTVRFYYLNSAPLDQLHYIGLEEWRDQWVRWIPQTKEMLLTALLLAGLVASGYSFGPRWDVLLYTSVMLIALCVVLPPASGLVIWDYDTFLGGVFFDLLSLELIPFFWWNVSSFSIVFFSLATIFYSYLYIFCRVVSPPQNEPNDLLQEGLAVAE